MGRCQERIQKAPQIPDKGKKFNQTAARTIEPKKREKIRAGEISWAGVHWAKDEEEVEKWTSLAFNSQAGGSFFRMTKKLKEIINSSERT